MLRAFLLSAFMLAYSVKNMAQPSLKGPLCAMSGMEYTYFIFTDADSNVDMEICITGGILSESGVSCQTTKATSSVKVIWDNLTGKGAIAIKTNSGNSTFNVTITNPLNGGAIDTAVKSQIVQASSIAKQILCSQASGGSCNPIFEYRWQQSADGTNWSTIPEAVGLNLKLTAFQKVTQYYRRQTTETNSGTVAYSNVAAIFLEPK